MATVLLIDDDAAFRALVRAALEENAIEVEETSTGREALSKLQDQRFEAIVVDGLLPDTTGPRWIETVRASGVMTPIIFVSAFFRDLESFRLLTQKLGVAEVVHKPVDPSVFARTVRAALPRERRTSMRIDLAAIERELGALEELKLDHSDNPPVHGRSPSTSVTPTRSLLGPEIVLLSDDDAEATFVRRTLGESLLRVRHLPSAALEDEALDADLVLLSLPYGRPGEASVALDRFDVRPRIAVLAGEDAPATRRIAEVIGADQFLVRPIGASGLLAAIEHMTALADRSPPRVLVWAQRSALRVADALENESVQVRRIRDWEGLRNGLGEWHPHAVVLDVADQASLRAVRMSEGGAAPALVVVGAEPREALFLDGASQVFGDDAAGAIARVAATTRVRLRSGDDRLTGLPRRPRFVQSLRAQAAAARRARAPIAFAFVRIRGAEGLALRQGESAAAAAARSCAELVRARFRLEDLRGLWSRDTFALAFPGTLGAQIAPAISRLQEEVGAMRFDGAIGPFRVDLSAGVASLRPENMSLLDVVSAAEEALRESE